MQSLVWGSNPSVREIFQTCPEWPRGPSSLLYIGYLESLWRVKRPERGTNHPKLAEVKERVKLHLYLTSGPSRPVLGWTLSYTNMGAEYVLYLTTMSSVKITLQRWPQFSSCKSLMCCAHVLCKNYSGTLYAHKTIMNRVLKDFMKMDTQ
jgi:hypothetical protein